MIGMVQGSCWSAWLTAALLVVGGGGAVVDGHFMQMIRGAFRVGIGGWLCCLGLVAVVHQLEMP